MGKRQLTTTEYRKRSERIRTAFDILIVLAILMGIFFVIYNRISEMKKYSNIKDVSMSVISNVPSYNENISAEQKNISSTNSSSVVNTNSDNNTYINSSSINSLESEKTNKDSSSTNELKSKTNTSLSSIPSSTPIKNNSSSSYDFSEEIKNNNESIDTYQNYIDELNKIEASYKDKIAEIEKWYLEESSSYSEGMKECKTHYNELGGPASSSDLQNAINQLNTKKEELASAGSLNSGYAKKTIESLEKNIENIKKRISYTNQYNECEKNLKTLDVSKTEKLSKAAKDYNLELQNFKAKYNL